MSIVGRGLRLIERATSLSIMICHRRPKSDCCRGSCWMCGHLSPSRKHQNAVSASGITCGRAPPPQPPTAAKTRRYRRHDTLAGLDVTRHRLLRPRPYDGHQGAVATLPNPLGRATAGRVHDFCRQAISLRQTSYRSLPLAGSSSPGLLATDDGHAINQLWGRTQIEIRADPRLRHNYANTQQFITLKTRRQQASLGGLAVGRA